MKVTQKFFHERLKTANTKLDNPRKAPKIPLFSLEFANELPQPEIAAPLFTGALL
ncbi:MAG: hypothetical protein IPP97_18315 [Candidatus Obscuribacter sp.]|jgi:hypothetical protein|nr:hypothetical protein [Candidatus Obscuribacter sp.]MBL0187689.1 hypothetical protein [Candidatus Obscuribacter sp.]MBP6348481.1 hypothetical protein [Candidatus Obscuribacter sp.]MBP6591928.1 hypothetical protein [Candidatus Obscuribacter sp.]MBP7576769.1 hypothetical protein [Candidatus Obscuribacter sp.]